MRNLVLLLCLNGLIFLSTFNTYSQSTYTGSDRKVVILDITGRSNELNKNVYSLEYICKTAGIPFAITTNVSEASHYPIIIVSSDINGIFNATENAQLTHFVDSGGVLVAPWVDDSTFNNLFGISEAITTRKHHRLTWTDSTETAFRWMNDSLEKTISLGNLEFPEVMYSCTYHLTTAKPIAVYHEDSTTGCAKNFFGKGTAYCLGFSFQSLVFVPQTNHDWESQRTYDNGFEPTSDVVMLFIKGLYAKYIKYATWKHTAPYNNTPIFLMTHDVDCAVAMETMNYFADWESANNIHATYFVTTHYTSDSQDNDYYSPFIKNLDSLVLKGFEIGSHSVGHLPDFNKLPLGILGNTRLNYNPIYKNGVSTGASIFGECEVSKDLLNVDINAKVYSFRPGYLVAPDSLVLILDTLGYKESSNNTANDVLTNFPYLSHKVRSYTSSLSHVLDMPLSISCDPLDDLKNDSIINSILPVTKKIYDNYAPIVMLIHPTIRSKLNLEMALIEKLSPKTIFMNVSELESYWSKRQDFNFSATLHNNDTKMVIVIPDSCFPIDPRMNIAINNGQNLNSILVQRQNGQSVNFLKANLETNDLLIYFSDIQNTTQVKKIIKDVLFFSTNPNPFIDQTTIEFNLKETTFVNIQIVDINGRLISTLIDQKMDLGVHQINYSPVDLKAGIYFCKLKTENTELVKKIIKE